MKTKNVEYMKNILLSLKTELKTLLFKSLNCKTIINILKLLKN